MKKCPFCRAEIEDSARFCLHCMRSLNQKEIIPARKKKKPQWSMIVAAIVAASLMLGILLPGGQMEDTSPSESQQLHSVPSSKPAESTGASVPSSQPATQNTAQPSSQATSPETLPTQSTPPPTQVTTPPTKPTEPTQQTQPTQPTQQTRPTQPVTEPTHPVTEPTTQPAEPPHIHSYTLQNTAAAYLKSEATCLAAAEYYYSCECGLKSSDFFSYGEKGSHTIVVDQAIPAGCVTPGLTEGSHCSVCEQVIVAQQKTEPAGHKVDTTDPMMPSICSVCMTLVPSPTPSISLKWPELPTVQYGRFRIDKCDFWADYNMDGSTFEVILYIEFTNISSSNYVAGVWATISGIEPSDGTSCELAPGESGTCRVTFMSIPAGTHTVSFE